MTGDHQINQVENLQGMQMIYYDILSGSVGFKGYRFFTISYLFIAQVLMRHYYQLSFMELQSTTVQLIFLCRW